MFFTMLLIIGALITYIIFSKHDIYPQVPNNEKAYRDSIQAGRKQYDSLEVAKKIKDSLYEQLQLSKPAIEYRTNTRLVYISHSNADTLDKIIRSKW